MGYLDGMINVPGAAEALACSRANGDKDGVRVPVEMDDLRVREYTIQETDYNRGWLRLSAHNLVTKVAFEVTSTFSTT